MAAAEGQGEVASRPAEPPAEPGAMGPANHRREDRSRSPHRIVQYLQKDEEFLDGLIVARRYVADLQKFLKIQRSIIEFQEQTFKQMDVTLEIALLAKKKSGHTTAEMCCRKKLPLSAFKVWRNFSEEIILLEKFYWRSSSDEILLEKFYWRNFTGEVLPEKFYRRSFIGEILLEKFC